MRSQSKARESKARATRKAAKKEAETNVDLKHSGGQKSPMLRVKVSGGIDGESKGKNAFDEAFRMGSHLVAILQSLCNVVVVIFIRLAQLWLCFVDILFVMFFICFFMPRLTI